MRMRIREEMSAGPRGTSARGKAGGDLTTNTNDPGQWAPETRRGD